MAVPADLIATTPKTPDAWTPAWRVHPGGSILSVAAFGDLLLVGTSERRLVAYSAGGVRLWQQDLAEIAPTPAARVDDDDAVLVDLGGTVRRFALATGAVRWQRSLTADVNRAPAVGAGLVVVADRGGTVTALDAGNGAPRWTADLAAQGLLVLAGTVAVVQDQVLHGLEVGTGRHRFVRAYRGGFTDLHAVAGRVALASKEETLLMDPDGSRPRTLPGYLALTAAGAHLVGWSAERLDVLDPAGAVVASWPTPPTSQISSARPGLAAPEGVFLFAYARGWTFDAWTTGG
jgi:outer membrane protein assembly factor BamB